MFGSDYGGNYMDEFAARVKGEVQQNQANSKSGGAKDQELGFWDRFKTYMNEGGLESLARVGDDISRSRQTFDRYTIPNRPGGVPQTNQGMMGIQQLIAAAARGGYGR